MAHHGGGAFSGKDPTKVDRSAAYAARYVAKNIVAAGLAKKCELALSYAIGVARPLSLRVDTFGTGAVSEEKLEKIVGEAFDLRPNAIIRALDLRRRFTARPPRTAISAAPTSTCRGRRPIRRRRCGRWCKTQKIMFTGARILSGRRFFCRLLYFFTPFCYNEVLVEEISACFISEGGFPFCIP